MISSIFWPSSHCESVQRSVYATQKHGSASLTLIQMILSSSHIVPWTSLNGTSRIVTTHGSSVVTAPSRNSPSAVMVVGCSFVAANDSLIPSNGIMSTELKPSSASWVSRGGGRLAPHFFVAYLEKSIMQIVSPFSSSMMDRHGALMNRLP